MKFQYIFIIVHLIANHSFIYKIPALSHLWPRWIQKNGVKKQCETDNDCNFPSACCHHPIISGEKFCCTGGYKKRDLVKAYIYQPIQSTFLKGG